MKEMVTKYEEKQKEMGIRRLLRSKFPISVLDISTRLRNVLEDNDILMVRDLITCKHYELRRLKGYGQKTHVELMELFDKHGWDLIE